MGLFSSVFKDKDGKIRDLEEEIRDLNIDIDAMRDKKSRYQDVYMENPDMCSSSDLEEISNELEYLIERRDKLQNKLRTLYGN